MRPYSIPFAFATVTLALAGCSEELGPERFPTATVSGRVRVQGRPVGGGWVEFRPVGATVGLPSSAKLARDGTFRAEGVPVGLLAIRLVHPPFPLPCGRLFEQVSVIRRTSMASGNPPLDIDLARIAPPLPRPLRDASLIFVVRLLPAQLLFHPLEGITFGDWRRLLRRERFRVSPLRWPRAVWLTAMSVVNSVAARRVERRHGLTISTTAVVAPVFILGHYRSGTTHLHDLLALDPNYASPTRFQAYNPSTFLDTETTLAPFVEPFMLPRRVQEDEIAPMNLSQLSPYLDWVFPRTRRDYRRTLTFRGASPAEVAAWSGALVRFLRMLTIRSGRPLILKSPPHTARVRLILNLFPDARFVHIRRDPYAVFASTMGLLKAIRPVFGLQLASGNIDEDAILATYKEMYDAYFEDRDLIPPGQLVEIAYEDLDRDPIRQVRAIYEGLKLGDFDRALPALEAYLATLAGYRKNRNPRLDDATRAKIDSACVRSFDAWGYPRGIPPGMRP